MPAAAGSANRARSIRAAREDDHHHRHHRDAARADPQYRACRPCGIPAVEARVNIGGDLMRRFGPRRPAPDGGHKPATPAAWVSAGILLFGGTGLLLAIAHAGFRSETAGKFAIVVSLAVIGAAVLVAVVRWIAAPISENAGLGMPDSASFLDRAWGFRGMSLDGHPVKIAVVLLVLLSADCALEVSAHWRWRPSTDSRRAASVTDAGLLRSFLAPAPGPAPGPAAAGPGAGPPDR